MTDDDIKLIFEDEFRGTNAYQRFARAIEARVLEELRKQEPVAWMTKDAIINPQRTAKFRSTHALGRTGDH